MLEIIGSDMASGGGCGTTNVNGAVSISMLESILDWPLCPDQPVQRKKIRV